MKLNLNFFSSLPALAIVLLISCNEGSNPAPEDLSISSFTPASGSDGTVVQITGTGFSATSAENTVFFGTTAAAVTAATATQLTVTLPPALPYGTLTISVKNGDRTAEASTPFTAGLETLQGEIKADKKLTKDKRYLLKGSVLVTNGATLTIDPGVIIKGDKSSSGTLIIGKGAKINALGTAQEPIVFTSNQAKGFRNYGDWGGVILLGKSTVNQGPDQNVEGLATEARFQYGGNVDNDNSGVMKYVRIEFCGIALSVGNEINGLTMGGVGSGTVIDHVQVSYSGDDSFEWFGGTVNCKYLISFRCFDDDFDTDLGYSGKVQYGLGLRDPYIADASQSNGFESDNSPTGVGTPATQAIFSNITCVAGSKLVRGTGTTDGVESDNYGRGAHLRRNTSQSIFNSVFLGSNLAGFSIDGALSTAKYESTGGTSADQIQLRGNVLSGTRPVSLPARGGDFSIEKGDVNTIGFFAPDASAVSFFTSNNQLNQSVSSLKVDNLILFSRLTNPVVVPEQGSILLSGALFTGKANDAFFDKVTFRGAFGTTNWAESWTNFDPQNTEY